MSHLQARPFNGSIPSDPIVKPKTFSIMEKPHAILVCSTGLSTIPIQQIWVNPDCGLKTRYWVRGCSRFKKYGRSDSNLT